MAIQKLAMNTPQVQLQAERVQWLATQQELQRIQHELETVKRSQAALQCHHERLQMALEASALGLWDWQIDANKIYYDPQWKRMLGYEVEEISNDTQAFEQLVHPEDLPKIKAVLADCIAGRRQFYRAEFRMRCKSGEWKWILDRGKVFEWDESGKPTRMAGTHKEMNDAHEQAGRKNLELAVMLFRQAVDHSNDAIAIADVHGNHFYHNRAFSQLFGYATSAEFQAAGGLTSIFANQEVAQQVLTTTIAGKSWQGEVPQISATGRQIHSMLRAHPIKDAQGKLVGIITVHSDNSKLRTTTNTLRYREQQLQEVQRLAHIGNWEFDLANGKFSLSDEFMSILGVDTPRECTFNELLRTIHPDDKPTWLQALKVAIREGNSPEFDFRVIRPNGEMRYLSSRKLAVKNELGRLQKLFGFATDITERKQAEISLQQQLLRERLVGKMRERIRSSLKLEAVLQTTVAEVRQFLEADRAFIYRCGGGDNGVSVESVAQGLDSIMGMNIPQCFLQQDMTLYAQGQIRAIADIYNSTLPTADVELLNQMEAKAALVVPILHTTDQQPRQNPLWGLLVVHQCSSPRQWQTSDMESLRQLSVQIAIAIQQSTLFEQAQTEIAERQLAEAREREKTQELQSTLRDLQDTQAQLVQNEKMASLGQLVAGVAHEINNPINFIYANITPATEYAQELIRLVELYQQHYPNPVAAIATEIEFLDLDFLKNDFLKLLWSMRAGSDRIKEIVMALRNFSRSEGSRMKKADLHEGLDSTLMILQHRLKEQPNRSAIQVLKEYGDIPSVECYPGDLNQVFMNILTNAIDAIEDRMKEDYSFIPQIKINTEVVSSHLSLVTSKDTNSSDKNHTPKNKILIRISDNGKGILPHIQKRIFDPFFTTKPVGKGTGLGLSISHQIIVEKHQGKLKCNSQFGKGTELVIEISAKAKGSHHGRIRASFS